MEQKLTRNPQYAYARELGQLSGLAVLSVVDPLRAYTGIVMAEGVRLGDIKPPALSNQGAWNTFVESLI